MIDLGVLSQHLIVLLDPDQFASDMQEAYRRVPLNDTVLGCFMMGRQPPPTVEATLVHGASSKRAAIFHRSAR